MREWMARPGNAERHAESGRKWRAKNREAYLKGKSDRRTRAARLMYQMGLVTGECKICGKEFRRRGGPGRPRLYCDSCVDEFDRSDRKCPRCSRVITRWGRRMTCGNCGALWMRGRPPQ